MARKAIIIWVSPEAHARVKSEAKRRGLTMSRFARNMINAGWKATKEAA